MDGKEIIPLHKIIQRENGEYFKCAPEKNLEIKSTTLSSLLGTTTAATNKHQKNFDSENDTESDVELNMQAVDPDELENFIKKKVCLLYIFIKLQF